MGRPTDPDKDETTRTVGCIPRAARSLGRGAFLERREVDMIGRVGTADK
jgi:hypothetical protein